MLNLPLSALQAAISRLKSRYKSESHQLVEAINEVLERNPRLRTKYKRLEPGSDRLYRSKFIYPLDNEASYAVAYRNNLSRLTVRHERTADKDNPIIYYSLITLGNQLIKDASVRDRFTAEKDILCFEIEVAGLINHFPYLIIRSIYDYSDSYKNKD